MLEFNSVFRLLGKEYTIGYKFQRRGGEFFGVIGTNGAGKTTLFRGVTKSIGLSGGSISFGGKDIASIPRLELARGIATMIPLYDMPFAFTAEEFVLMGRFPHRKRFESDSSEDARIAEECMRFTDTLDFRDRKLNELSGGERQRLVLAQALPRNRSSCSWTNRRLISTLATR